MSKGGHIISLNEKTYYLHTNTVIRFCIKMIEVLSVNTQMHLNDIDFYVFYIPSLKVQNSNSKPTKHYPSIFEGYLVIY